MKTNIIISNLIFLSLLCSSTAEDTDDPPGEKISLSVPKLSEEETESNHMPNHLKCDACLAVAYQIQTAFKEMKKKRPRVKESDVLDVLEQICSTGFNDYGVKQVDNVNRLSGPGLETEHVMGMTQMGGRWPHRLQEMCHYYVGEAGEMDIYNAFTKNQDSLVRFLCKGRGVFSYCSQMKPSIKTEL